MKKTIIIIAALALSSTALMAQKKAVVQTTYSNRTDAVIGITNILENQGFDVENTNDKKLTGVMDPTSRKGGPDGKQRPQGPRPDGANGQMPQGGPGGGMGGPGGGMGGPGGGMGGPGGGMGGPGGGMGGPGGGMGGFGGGMGGPGGGMGPGGMGGMQSESTPKYPTVIVTLKEKKGVMFASFKTKNFPDPEKDAKKASKKSKDSVAPAPQGMGPGQPGGPMDGPGMHGPMGGNPLRKIVSRVPNTGVEFK